MVAYAGYGAIGAVYGMLKVSVADLLATFDDSIATGTAFDPRPYRVAAEGMTVGLTSLPSTPAWDDARTQLLTLIERYRELVDILPPEDMETFRAVSAELDEARLISDLAIGRLGRRLGLASDDGQ